MAEGWRQRIRRLLGEQQLTMKEASRRAGRGETFVRDILERGQEPSASNLEGLAKVLGVSGAELLHGQPDVQYPDSGNASRATQGFAETTGVDVRAELAEVFADLVKADEGVQRAALKMLRRTVYGPGKSRPTKINGSS